MALTRRASLRAGSAVLVGAGALGLDACGPAAARPKAQHANIVLTFQPNGPLNRTTHALYQNALAPFYAAHPGVHVNLVPAQWRGNVAQIIGGAGSDVIWDNYPPAYFANNGSLLLPLDHLIRRDNIDVRAWSASQIASYRQAAPGRGLYMLPNYFSPLAYVVRLSDFDEAGLQRPNPNWTEREFVRACQQMTRGRKNGHKRYGAVVQWHTGALGGASWPFYAWGGGMINAAGYADVASPSGLRAGKWLYEELFWPGYATARDILDPNAHPTAQIEDLVVCQLVWGDLPLYHAQNYHGFRWDYYLPPTFPKGPTCEGTDDFFAIPRTTRQPELAWDLLKFISYDASPSGWQRSNMRTTLIQPCLNALWDVWIATLRSVAPPLRHKNLEVFKTMAMNGRAFPGEYFQVGDLQARQLFGPAMGAIWRRQEGVTVGFQQIDRSVNASLASTLRAEKRAQVLARALRVGPGGAYPRPSATGSVAAPALATFGHGSLTLTGDGAAVAAATDACAFAAAAEVAPDATYTCRLRAFSQVHGLATHGWTMAGLMARSNLRDHGAMVLLGVTRDHGLVLEARPASGAAPQIQVGAAGLLPAAQVTRAAANAKTGYLRQPVWLRLQRRATTWTAFTSLDGKRWTAAGKPVDLKMAGAWVGTFATAYNGAAGASGPVHASFDDLRGLTLAAADVWQIGKP